MILDADRPMTAQPSHEPDALRDEIARAISLVNVGRELGWPTFLPEADAVLPIIARIKAEGWRRRRL